MRNQYIGLELRLLYRMLKNKKLTFRKIANALCCFYAYFFKLERSGKAPMMVSVELMNECPANCLFCRNEKGQIYNSNPLIPKETIAKGKMPFQKCQEIIKQLKDHVLIGVLYTNGEPLLYDHIIEALRFARDSGMATIIATNGLLLSQAKILQLLESGVDLIKIALSGYTQQVYGIQVRNGDVETVKNNIRMLAARNREGKFGAIIMVDYILYNYNRHELGLMRKFCADSNIMLNVRKGNPGGGLEGREPALFDASMLPLQRSCDWLWKAMQINWNGDILPCCDAVVWGGAEPFGTFKGSESDIPGIWNGRKYIAARQAFNKTGRKALPMCSSCVRRGIAFKW